MRAIDHINKALRTLRTGDGWNLVESQSGWKLLKGTGENAGWWMVKNRNGSDTYQDRADAENHFAMGVQEEDE